MCNETSADSTSAAPPLDAASVMLRPATTSHGRHRIAPSDPCAGASMGEAVAEVVPVRSLAARRTCRHAPGRTGDRDGSEPEDDGDGLTVGQRCGRHDDSGPEGIAAAKRPMSSRNAERLERTPRHTEGGGGADVERRRGHLIPVVAMPSVKWRWKKAKMRIIGTVTMHAASGQQVPALGQADGGVVDDRLEASGERELVDVAQEDEWPHEIGPGDLELEDEHDDERRFDERHGDRPPQPGIRGAVDASRFEQIALAG